MKLVSFSVRHYRSITTTTKLQIGTLTSLIGPNNEGKSNILRALVLSLGFLEALQHVQIARSGVLARYMAQRQVVDAYDWSIDYPLSLQKENSDGTSRFDLEFELTQDEIISFKKEIGSNLNGTLPIRFYFGASDNVQFDIIKQGKGKEILKRKRSLIIKFISKRIGLAYIPTIRTAEQAEAIINNLIGRTLSSIINEPEYIEAIGTIQRLQEPVLRDLETVLTDTLKLFLPNVRQVSLELTDLLRTGLHSTPSAISIDDGTPTSLARKGDGVQSLAALALMRYISHSSAAERRVILAVEEPESHLHPEAIHELKEVLNQIAQSNQVILTTHNPLFVNRNNIGSNILVQDSRARIARDLADIRSMLGVRVSDNLSHAQLVLIVEGDEDRESLTSIFRAKHENLSDAILNGTLTIESMHGSSNLVYKLSEVQRAMCNVHCFLDHDQAGKDAAKKAINDNLVTTADVTYATHPMYFESELEDLLNPSIYADFLSNKYRVSLDVGREWTNKRGKWSVRMEKVFKTQGQTWSSEVKTDLKREVCRKVTQNPSTAIDQACSTVVDKLAEILTSKLTVTH